MLKYIALLRKLKYSNQLQTILIFGILFRIIIFIFQGPFNNDHHFEVVKYIYSHHALPISNQLEQSYHPPLYYILASLFVSNYAKTVQLFSLFLSIGTLCIIYWLIKNLESMASFKARKYCLLLTCLLPQFVMFSNYISSDSLSFFIGSLIFMQVFLYIHRPKLFRLVILAIYLGLGLLTKGTFLSFIPPLILLIGIISIIDNFSFKKRMCQLLIFIFIFSAVGSCKYVENIIHFHRPIVHNLDANPPWALALDQRPTFRHVEEFLFDIDLIKLSIYPMISEHTSHSLPLLLYGTLWYQYIPESNFIGNRTKFRSLGSCIYILALLPTLLFFIGFFTILFSVKKVFCDKEANKERVKVVLYHAICLFILLLNFLLMVMAGIKYDAWSCYQSRLLFPSFFAIILLFNFGLAYIEKKNVNVQEIVYLLLKSLFILFIVYFIAEIFIMLYPNVNVFLSKLRAFRG